MKTIAVVNQKGGVGKTATSVNLAVGLARNGKKVVAIDLDAQGSLTLSLGFNEPDKLPVTISTLMEYILDDSEISVTDGILHHFENIDLIPANIELSGMEVTLVNTMSRETILKQYLKVIENEYDYAILDCSPSLNTVTINALACCDEVIIPVQSQYLPVKGMEQLFKTIGKVKKQINPNLSISGILITMVDVRTNFHNDIINIIKETYGSKIRIFKSFIPQSIRVSEISAEGKSIYAHDCGCKASIAYDNLVKEVLGEVVCDEE